MSERVRRLCALIDECHAVINAPWWDDRAYRLLVRTQLVPLLAQASEAEADAVMEYQWELYARLIGG